MFDFEIVSGTTVKKLLAEQPSLPIETVEKAYLAHHDGLTVNPDSYFLRFPNNPENRIIALPASIATAGDMGVSGIKWIASFPGNVKHNIPRASAVLLLNDPQTGYPFACLEGSLISAVRTAASAVLGAFWLNDRKCKTARIGFVGAGVIARNIFDTFVGSGWEIGAIAIHDSDPKSCQSFAQYAKTKGTFDVQVEETLAGIVNSEIVVFATNAGEPYVLDGSSFHPGQVVLNISLRDLSPDLILSAQNIFDDVDHCMKANTSPHLAEQKVGNRDFVTGTLAEVMRGEITLTRTRPLIFSPFGMGILDLALGKALFDEARGRGMTTSVPDFFGESSRWQVGEGR